jgi:hypothetical protein
MRDVIDMQQTMADPRHAPQSRCGQPGQQQKGDFQRSGDELFPR